MARTLLPYIVNPPQGGTASLINRVRPKATNATATPQEKKKMARKRKLYGAAAAAHAKKAGKASGKKRRKARPARKARKARRARRAAPAAAAPSRKRRVTRKRHQVKRYHRAGGQVKSYRRKGANVKKHWSNPFGLGQAGSVAMEGLIAAGAILGTLFVVGYANNQLHRFPVTSSGWGNLAGKFALAVGAGMGAGYLYKRRMVSKEVAYAMTGAAMAPLLLGGLAMLSPQIAGSINLAGPDEGVSGVVEYGAVGAELQAQLEAELNAQLEAEESESGMV